MILFRHISLRERWARHLPTWGEVLAVALFFVACVLVLDYLRGGVTQRAVMEVGTAAAKAEKYLRHAAQRRVRLGPAGTK